MMPTIYLRRERTTLSDVYDGLKYMAEKDRKPWLQEPGHMDVVCYVDRECAKPIARFSWHDSNKPTRRNKYVTLNCVRHRAVWLDEKVEVPA